MTEDTEIGDRFRVSGTEIISETFDDGESIVVNLENGFYFSLNEVGGVVFDLLSSGLRVREIVAVLADRYVAEPTTIEVAVGDFALRLVDEGLILPEARVPRPRSKRRKCRRPPVDGRAPSKRPSS